MVDAEESDDDDEALDTVDDPELERVCVLLRGALDGSRSRRIALPV